MSGRPTFQKRQKEKSRQDKQKEKEVKREQRKSDKANGAPMTLDEQIAAIVPGPQPIPEDED